MQWTSDCTKALASTKERGDKKALKSLKKKQVNASCCVCLTLYDIQSANKLYFIQYIATSRSQTDRMFTCSQCVASSQTCLLGAFLFAIESDRPSFQHKVHCAADKYYGSGRAH